MTTLSEHTITSLRDALIAANGELAAVREAWEARGNLWDQDIAEAVTALSAGFETQWLAEINTANQASAAANQQASDTASQVTADKLAIDQTAQQVNTDRQVVAQLRDQVNAQAAQIDGDLQALESVEVDTAAITAERQLVEGYRNQVVAKADDIAEASNLNFLGGSTVVNVSATHALCVCDTQLDSARWSAPLPLPEPTPGVYLGNHTSATLAVRDHAGAAEGDYFLDDDGLFKRVTNVVNPGDPAGTADLGDTLPWGVVYGSTRRPDRFLATNLVSGAGAGASMDLVATVLWSLDKGEPTPWFSLPWGADRLVGCNSGVGYRSSGLAYKNGWLAIGAEYNDATNGGLTLVDLITGQVLYYADSAQGTYPGGLANLAGSEPGWITNQGTATDLTGSRITGIQALVEPMTPTRPERGGLPDPTFVVSLITNPLSWVLRPNPTLGNLHYAVTHTAGGNYSAAQNHHRRYFVDGAGQVFPDGLNDSAGINPIVYNAPEATAPNSIVVPLVTPDGILYGGTPDYRDIRVRLAPTADECLSCQVNEEVVTGWVPKGTGLIIGASAHDLSPLSGGIVFDQPLNYADESAFEADGHTASNAFNSIAFNGDSIRIYDDPATGTNGQIIIQLPSVYYGQYAVEADILAVSGGGFANDTTLSLLYSTQRGGAIGFGTAAANPGTYAEIGKSSGRGGFTKLSFYANARQHSLTLAGVRLRQLLDNFGTGSALLLNGNLTRTPVADNADLAALQGFTDQNFGTFELPAAIGSGNFHLCAYAAPDLAEDRSVFCLGPTDADAPAGGFRVYAAGQDLVIKGLGLATDTFPGVFAGTGFQRIDLLRLSGTVYVYVEAVARYAEANATNLTATTATIGHQINIATGADLANLWLNTERTLTLADIAWAHNQYKPLLSAGAKCLHTDNGNPANIRRLNASYDPYTGSVLILRNTSNAPYLLQYQGLRRIAERDSGTTSSATPLITNNGVIAYALGRTDLYASWPAINPRNALINARFEPHYDPFTATTERRASGASEKLLWLINLYEGFTATLEIEVVAREINGGSEYAHYQLRARITRPVGGAATLTQSLGGT